MTNFSSPHQPETVHCIDGIFSGHIFLVRSSLASPSAAPTAKPWFPIHSQTRKSVAVRLSESKIWFQVLSFSSNNIGDNTTEVKMTAIQFNLILSRPMKPFGKFRWRSGSKGTSLSSGEFWTGIHTLEDEIAGHLKRIISIEFYYYY